MTVQFVTLFQQSAIFATMYFCWRDIAHSTVTMLFVIPVGKFIYLGTCILGLLWPAKCKYITGSDTFVKVVCR